MAELLVRTIDKIGSDVYLDAQCTKRGDVVVVQPDGWAWSVQERTAPFWRILKLPRVSESEASMCVSEEPEWSPNQPSRTRRRRFNRLNLAALFAKPTERAYLQDDGRSEQTFTLQMSFTQLSAFIEQKSPIPDPRIIGEDPAVL